MSTFKKTTIGLIAGAMMVAAGSAQANSSQSTYQAFMLDLIDAGPRAAMPQLSESDLGYTMGQFVTLPTTESTASNAGSNHVLFLVPSDTSRGVDGVSSSFHAQAGSSFGSSSSTGMGHVVDKSDPLVVIPLPSAALAGMGMLVGIAGVSYLRKRK